jgi:hypothetical protein
MVDASLDVATVFEDTKYINVFRTVRFVFNNEGKTKPKSSHRGDFFIRGTFGKPMNLGVTPTDGSAPFDVESDDHCVYLIACHPTKNELVSVGFDDIHIHSWEQKPGETLSLSDFKIVAILKERIFELANVTKKDRRLPLKVSSIRYQEDGTVLEIIHNFGTTRFATDSI